MGEAAFEQHTVLSQLSVSRRGREGTGGRKGEDGRGQEGGREGGEGTRGKGREEGKEGRGREGRGQEGRGGRKRGGDERGGEERDERGEGNHKCTYNLTRIIYVAMKVPSILVQNE